MGKMINEDDCEPGLPAWMATFGDLMSLLLTFFVLLLSFSSSETVKFNHAMGSLRGSLGVFQSEPEMSQPISITMPLVRGSVRQSNNIRKAAGVLEKSLSDEGLEGDVLLEGTASGLVIRIQAPVVYDLGTAEFKPEIVPIMYLIGNLIAQLPNEVVVQGHTDDRPIRTAFPSNWELSLQRSINAVRFFIADCGVHPRRLGAEGFGEHRPIASNATEEGRRRNRRIEIHIIHRGVVDENLEEVADLFKKSGLDGQRDGGGEIVKPRRRRR